MSVQGMKTRGDVLGEVAMGHPNARLHSEPVVDGVTVYVFEEHDPSRFGMWWIAYAPCGLRIYALRAFELYASPAEKHTRVRSYCASKVSAAVRGAS